MGRGRKSTSRKAGDRRDRKAVAGGENSDATADTTRKSSRKRRRLVNAKRKGEKNRVTPKIELTLSCSEDDDVETKPVVPCSSSNAAAGKGLSGKKRTRSSISSSDDDDDTEREQSRARMRSRGDVTSKSTPSKNKSEKCVARNRDHEARPTLDVFSMSKAKIDELQSSEFDIPTCWRFDTFTLFGRDMSNNYMCKFTDFVSDYKDYVKFVLWKDSPVSAMKEYDSLSGPIRPLIYESTHLKEITLTDAAPAVIMEFLTRMIAAKQQGNLEKLDTFKISSVLGTDWLDDLEMELLTVSKIPWRELQISDCSVHPAECHTLERILKANVGCLESFEFFGACPTEKDEQLTVVVPKMLKLEHFSVRVQLPPKGDDMDSVKPFRKSDWAPKDVPQNMTNFEIDLKKNKLTLTLPPDLPRLKSLVLGNGVEVRNLSFSIVKKLETFHCGGQWHLTMKFPPEENQSAFRDSRVTSLQLPDDLRDPSYVKKFAKYFPNVTKLTVNLPSVVVLRSIFLHFGPAKLEELTLRTQYDFDTVLDSALFPNLQLTPNQATQKDVETLKTYKVSKQVLEDRRVELPGQAVDPTTKGIDSLKKLKRLHLQHIPRLLQIPLNGNVKKPERRETKFLTCSSSEDISLSKKTYEKLLQLMDRDHLTLEGITISVICSSDTDDTDDDEDEDSTSELSATSSGEDN